MRALAVVVVLTLLTGCVVSEDKVVPRLEDDTAMGKIHWLLSNHHLFSYTLDVDEESRRIIWEIRGPPPALEILSRHIAEMGEMLERGQTPRRMDPVFRLEGMVKENITTHVRWNGDKLVVEKRAKDPCSFEVIKAHARVVEGFFTKGWEEARRMHPITKEIASACGAVLNQEGI